MSNRYSHIFSALENIKMEYLIPVIEKYDYFFEGKRQLLLKHYATISKVIELTDGRIVICSNDAIRIFNLYTNNQPIVLNSVIGFIINILELPDNKILAINKYNSIDIWDLNTNTILLSKNLELKENTIKYASILSNSDIVLGTDNEIIIFNSEDLTQKHIFPSGNILALTSSENKIIVATNNITLQIYGEENKDLSFLEMDKIKCLSMETDKILLAGTYSGDILMIDINSGNILKRIMNSTEAIPINQITMLSNANIITVSSNYIKVWELRKADPIFSKLVSHYDINHIEVLPNNNIINSNRRETRIWNVETGESFAINSPGDVFLIKVLSTGEILIVSQDDSYAYLTLWE